MEEKRKIVEVKGLSFSYEGRKGEDVINQANFCVWEGERVMVLGRMGAGKSTLALMLAGLLKKKSGELVVCGENPSAFGEGVARTRIGFVPESPVFFENKTIRYNLDYARSVLGFENISDSEFGAVLERLGVSRDKKVKELNNFEKFLLERERLALKKLELLIVDRRSVFFQGEREAKKIVAELLNASESVVVVCNDINDIELFAAQKFKVLYVMEGRVFEVQNLECLMADPREFLGGVFDANAAMVARAKGVMAGSVITLMISKSEYQNAIECDESKSLKKRKNACKTCEKPLQNSQIKENNANLAHDFVCKIEIGPTSKMFGKMVEFFSSRTAEFILFAPKSNIDFGDPNQALLGLESGEIILFFEPTGERV